MKSWRGRAPPKARPWTWRSASATRPGRRSRMTRRTVCGEEDGSLLLVIMVGVAVMTIGLGVTSQAWSSTWRRDSEEALISGAGQYVNGILAYRKEHNGQFPLDLTDLMKEGPRRLRYIRKLFRDPIN